MVLGYTMIRFIFPAMCVKNRQMNWMDEELHMHSATSARIIVFIKLFVYFYNRFISNTFRIYLTPLLIT